jgi:hypothetical protein
MKLKYRENSLIVSTSICIVGYIAKLIANKFKNVTFDAKIMNITEIISHLERNYSEI